MGKTTRNISVQRFLVSEWLPAIEPTIRRSTYCSYESQIRIHILPKLGRMPLRSVSGRTLNAFYGSLLKNNGGPLSPSTVRRVHACLHRAFRDAVRWGYLEMSPAENCDPPKDRGRNTEMRTWTAGELGTFLAHAVLTPLHALWVVFATTGMRRGEALGLRWCDIDLDSAILAVRQTLIQVGGELLYSTPKTARGKRVIALDAHTVDVLRQHRQQAKPRSDDQLVFNADGHPLVPGDVSNMFRSLAWKAGVPRIRLHDLRHTHATLALQAGIHPKIVSERLGHSTISFTLDVYSHAVPHMQKEAAERIGDLVFRSTSQAPSGPLPPRRL